MEKRTYSDRAEYLKKAVTERRRTIKLKAIDLLGGKCQACGYKKTPWALQFHHKDPNGKDFGISQRGHSRAWEKVKLELEKCVLVCANCHHEIHAGILQPFWETKK